MAFGGRFIVAALFRAFTTLQRLHDASMCCVRLADGTSLPNVELRAASPILAVASIFIRFVRHPLFAIGIFR